MYCILQVIDLQRNYIRRVIIATPLPLISPSFPLFFFVAIPSCTIHFVYLSLSLVFSISLSLFIIYFHSYHYTLGNYYSRSPIYTSSSIFLPPSVYLFPYLNLSSIQMYACIACIWCGKSIGAPESQLLICVNLKFSQYLIIGFIKSSFLKNSIF